MRPWHVRLPTQHDLTAARWAWLATGEVQRLLKSARVADVRVKPAPTSGSDRVVRGVLRVRRASCLTRSFVQQEWGRAHGRRLDVVVGVRRQGVEFRAHAWLEPGGHAPEFVEIYRVPTQSSA